MKIDPASRWRAELVADAGVTYEFDTPRCALLAWRTSRVKARALRVQEYYGGGWKDGREVRFVFGSDVVGPMGTDVIPVDPLRAEAFLRDHHGALSLELEAITPERLLSP